MVLKLLGKIVTSATKVIGAVMCSPWFLWIRGSIPGATYADGPVFVFV